MEVKFNGFKVFLILTIPMSIVLENEVEIGLLWRSFMQKASSEGDGGLLWCKEIVLQRLSKEEGLSCSRVFGL